MSKFIEIFPDLTALVERSHDLVKEKIEQSITARGICTLALAGGSTPKPLYEMLSQDSLPWENIHIFWGDERYVPPTHPDSNEKMARTAWLDQVQIPHTNIHPMPTLSSNPELDAEEYDTHLREFFSVQPGEFPCFDLILLGMGDDGHTASLFPHTPALRIRDRLITVGNKNEEPRLTFTVPLINTASCVLFMVAGANKQKALEQVFLPEGDDFNYPSRLIKPQGELWWFLEENAAKKIKYLV
jgi:6-phosphogluconolactonase